jgi:hypothetical protein
MARAVHRFGAFNVNFQAFIGAGKPFVFKLEFA